MHIVIQGHRPETFDRRELTFREGDRIKVVTIELLALTVVVPVDVFGFLRAVVIHIRSGGAGAIEVVGAPLRVVHRRVPAVAGGTTVVTPLEERWNQVTLGGEIGRAHV